MTNVEDEINADGVINHQLSTISNQQNLSVDVTDSRGTDAKIKEEIPKSTQIMSLSETSPHHNLRPKRSLRHVHALKQQAKRRKRNTSIAAAAASSGATSSSNISNSPDPSTITIQRTMSRKTSIGKDNGDIEIHFKPDNSRWTAENCSVKDVLQSIPGFSMSKIRNKKGSNKKLSLAAAIQQAHEGVVDLESPESLLTQVNMRSLLNKNTFLKLPPQYQYKLVQLLPQIDLAVDGEANYARLSQSALNNEFLTKACHEWKERLLRGDFTSES